MSDNQVLDVGPDEFPLYTNEAEPEEKVPEKIDATTDSETVSGIQAVTASARGPNKLVATDATGKLPSAIIPSATSGVLQIVYNSTSATNSTAVTIPVDDTIPQNTEGAEMLTASITPQSASSNLYIIVSMFVNGPGGGYSTTTALFKDSGADAIAAVNVGDNDQRSQQAVIIHKIASGSTSSQTFKVRCGSSSGTFRLNGISGRLYGGVASSSITIVEML